MEILGFSKLRQEKNATDARKVFLYMKEDVTRVVSDVKELDTYQVRVFNEDKSDEDREEYTFEIPFQKGSIKVNGRNGVMIEELLEIVAMRITDLNGKFQCKENEEAIELINKAIAVLDDRTRDRIARQVEGQCPQGRGAGRVRLR